MTAKKIAAIALVGALALAACGDDDETTSTTAGDGTTATTEADATDTTEGEATDTTEGDTTATTADTTEGDATDTTEGDATDTTEAPDDGGDVFAVDTSSCDDPDMASAEITDPLKIGISYPQSGGPAVLFAAAGEGVKAYIDYFNETTGGINGQPVELIAKDDQYMADLTKQNVDVLVYDEEVDVLSGIIGSANNSAVQADLNALCIPQLWALTGSAAWGNIEQYPWTTGALVPYSIEVETFLTYAAEQFPDGGRLGLFYVNNEFGQEYKIAVDARAAEFGFEVVAEETIDFADSGAPTAQVSNLVAADLDAVIAVPLGAQCIGFMTEIGNARAANTDFDPLIYQTGTCASTIFFGAVSNGGSDGVLTGTMFKDVANVELQTSDPGIAEYLTAFAASGSTADPSTLAAAGWVTAEVTLHTLEQAAASGTLSRESIINAARNIDFVPSLLRDGLGFHMNASDGYAAEGAQLITWDAANTVFVDVGEPQNFDGLLGVYEG
ncbi:MAG TPA: ABC transporter substrate-binding protein [Ilumatobacter sp.]|nr:ABC transporter substrate-binding protein [Ilumatobacter sp.]